MIRIGTDCSGIEAPIEALKQLRVSFEHKWSCEIDKFARKSILANHEPEILYEDILKRDHSQLPDIDMYVCGFPCQAFSCLGKKKGLDDPRGTIMFECIKVIKTKKPKIFILENVKHFRYLDKGKVYNYLIETLDSIGEYSIYPDIYNTKDYGIPQNRERLYIIGIRNDCKMKEFVKPAKLPLRDLDEFIIDTKKYNINLMNYTNERLKKNGLNLDDLNQSDNYVISRTKYVGCMKNLSPAITTNPRHYLIKYNRYMFPLECLLLQGFSLEFKQTVSNTQMTKQAGNSMSVNVLKEIILEIFKCIEY